MPATRYKRGASKKAKSKAQSANIREMRHAHPDWPMERVIAAGINMAKPKKKKRKKKSK